MPVVLGLVPLVLVIVIIWPIVALARQRKEPADYPLTASVAAWYAQIMAMVGIVVFTAGVGYLFKSLIGSLNLSFSYWPAPLPIPGIQGPANAASLEQQRLLDLAVRTPVLLVSGPVIYFVHAYLSRTASPQRGRAPGWVRRGSQLVQTIFLGVVGTLCSVLALTLLLGYLVISPSPGQANVPFGEMLGFALAFTGAFVAHVLIWRSYPGGTWWSPPDAWPPQRKRSSPDRSHDPAAS
jgi:hypothetical protein